MEEGRGEQRGLLVLQDYNTPSSNILIFTNMTLVITIILLISICTQKKMQQQKSFNNTSHMICNVPH